MSGHSRFTVGPGKIDRIPDYFLERYAEEFAAWAQNARKINPEFDEKGRLVKSTKHFVFNEGAFAADSPQEDQGKVLGGATLVATFSAKGVQIQPLTEWDERLIANHCAKLKMKGVPARAKLVEPPRPGLPFLPTVRKVVGRKPDGA